MEERRFSDYFVVAGLPEHRSDPSSQQQDTTRRPTIHAEPIVDIVIINHSAGETPPEDFHLIASTPSGYNADLNYGSLISPEMYLCFRRGRHKPPLTDIGVMYEKRGEKPKRGCEVISETPYGRSANVNNTNGDSIYITYCRADQEADIDLPCIVDICVIIPSKGEAPPHAFHQINKTLNKGMLSTDVFLCYKKLTIKSKSLFSCPAELIGRYPLDDYESFALPSNVSMFCLPFGATIESWPVGTKYPLPAYSTFVLTGATGERVYGGSVIFYEDYPVDRLTEEQRAELLASSTAIAKRLSSRLSTGSQSEETVHNVADQSDVTLGGLMTLQQTKAICVLSRWPFFDIFRQILMYLYRISVSGPQPIPIERYISHYLTELPFPSNQSIHIQLGIDLLIVSQIEDSPLPKSGASFTDLLYILQPENCISVLLYALMEHRILIHGLRQDTITGIAEAIANMIFPLRWQCPYIPLCPLALSDVLDTPTPFLVGLNSRYFDMYEPPSDITFIDLNTVTITPSEERTSHTLKLFPKKALRDLRSRLDHYYDLLVDDKMHPTTPDDLDRQSILRDFNGQQKLGQLETQIQESFLRFMATILTGYSLYLKPIMKRPTDATTNLHSLFNVQGFLKSRERSYQKFYTELMGTQCFSRFIEERSFVSDTDTEGLTFFDECIKRLSQSTGHAEFSLLESEDGMQSRRAVYVVPPEAAITPKDGTNSNDSDGSVSVLYSCEGFSNLRPELFTSPQGRQQQLNNSINNSMVSFQDVSVSGVVRSAASGAMLCRTKQEMRASHKVIACLHDKPLLWTNCLLWQVYSVWFMTLPSYLSTTSQSHLRVLSAAHQILRRSLSLDIQPADEVCYRILLHQCGVYGLPAMAVKAMVEMQRHNIVPNAVTYGFYNRVVLESVWPTSSSRARVLWSTLRNTIIAVGKFKQPLKNKSLSELDGSMSSSDTCSNVANWQEALLYNVPESSTPNKKLRASVILETPDGSKTLPLTNDQRSTITNFNDGSNLINNSYGDGLATDSSEPAEQIISSRTEDLKPAISSELVLVTENDPLGAFRRSSSPVFGSADAKRQQKLNAESIANRTRESSIPRHLAIAEEFNRKLFAVTPPANELMQNNDVCSILRNNTDEERLDTKSQSSDELSTVEISYAILPRYDERTIISDGETTDPEQQRSYIPAPITKSLTFARDQVRRHESVPLSRTGSKSELDESSSHCSSDSFSVRFNRSAAESVEIESAADKTTSKSFYEHCKTLPLPQLKRVQHEENGSSSLIARASSAGNILPTASALWAMTSKYLRFGGGTSGDETDSKGGSPGGGSKDSLGPRKSVPGSDMCSIEPHRAFSWENLTMRRTSIDTRSSTGTKAENVTIQRPISNVPSNDALDRIIAADFDDCAYVSSTDIHERYLNSSACSVDFLHDGALADERDGKAESVAVEVTMCSETWCSNCSNLVFDEEVMASWTKDDSNYKIVCISCGYEFVPKLQIIITRNHTPSLSLSTAMIPTVSTEANKASEHCMFVNSDLADSLLTDSVPTDLDTVSSNIAFSDVASCDTLGCDLIAGDLTETLPTSDHAVAINEHHMERRDLVDDNQPRTDLGGGDSDGMTAAGIGMNIAPPQPVVEELSVPYISPLVLRKELENVIQQLGESCLVQSCLLTEHPVIYWNMVWLFKRLNLSTHMEALLLKSNSTVSQNILNGAVSCSGRRVLVRAQWDGQHTVSQFGLPMHAQYTRAELGNSDAVSSSSSGLVFDKEKLNSVVLHLREHDIIKPMQLILNERTVNTKRKSSGLYRSMYRELMFLSIIAIGRSSIDSFDAAYRRAYDNLFRTLSQRGSTKMMVADRPPNMEHLNFRRAFGKLALLM